MEDAVDKQHGRTLAVAGPRLAMAEECQSIDWYHEGETRKVEVAGVEISVRLVGRKGRRARIAITAPAGSLFRGIEATTNARQ
jgi:hypothetical protein